MKTFLPTTLFTACACLLSHTALCDVLFNTFGPGDSFDAAAWESNWRNSVTFGSDGLASAARFQFASGSYNLSSVSLALGYIQGTNNLAIRIVADNAGQPTGPILETVVSHPIGITGPSQVVTYPSSLEPVLTGGNNYWLVLEPADPNVADDTSDGLYNWFVGSNLPQGIAASHSFDFSSQSWRPWDVRNSSLPAFRIEGVLVPEPGSLGLMAAGTATLLGLHARRKVRERARNARSRSPRCV